MALPETIGDYQVEALLGRGGWSEVFKVRRDGQAFALKRILGTEPDGRPTEAELKRLTREIATLERLDDPRVVRLRDHGQTPDGTPFLVFDLIEGETLSALIERDRAAALAVLHDVALALAAAHRLGVIHRDVKPANILIRPGADRPQGVLVDFGLARATDSSTLTQDGDVLGTPAYMAPEQADGRAAEAGPACDVYGLGAVLYHVLTGTPPFEGSGLVQLLRAVVDEAPRPPSERRPDVDPALESLALESLAKAPDQRPPSAVAFAARLAAALPNTAASAAEEELDYATRNAPTLGLIAAGALLFLTVLAFEATRPAPPIRASAAIPRDEVSDDDVGHHVDPIDAAALAAAESVGGPASDPSVHTPIDPEEVAAETPVGPAPAKTAKTPAGPARPKTAARVHCHECGRKQQRADENFCPTCAIAYVCGACGEARAETTGATCKACQARFE